MIRSWWIPFSRALSRFRLESAIHGLPQIVPKVFHRIEFRSVRRQTNQSHIVRNVQLAAGVKTGLKIQYRNPLEVGADRIANAIAGVDKFPGENLVIVDLGTATTLCVISKDRSYRGGIILPGLRMSMQALESGTSKLGSVEIIRRDTCLGRATAESIQSGLYFGHLGALREILQRVQQEEFNGQRPKVIATGGFASLFDGTDLFDQVIPDLVLRGLMSALSLNAD